MTAPEIIALVAIVLIIGAAIGYLVYSKRRGKKCVGCPYSDSCSSCSCKKDK